ncbi:2-amino-4-hydroxy-6-hydroxymethyldihydropteridine diphosphokinase [Arenibaculum sp.]|uniref:2-amino-4-hydroxy-6- hydroxymethyldihydropteridine diphosphokinase n=1 Tax=Arenibaculum sp. TaxID=2865862 RepID=UPI002E149EAC|nr:2-amino-4-hydroxy-6-hydroxymethyldihydropteridine diphosphokinase [Arenibaculum sp.]
MILIGIGSNLAGGRFGGPREVCEEALRRLERGGVEVTARSRWYRTAPVPVSEQPWFVNAVVAVATSLGPAGLLEELHRIEAEFGRIRKVRNEARVLDLDLLAYGGLVRTGPAGPELPHPRLHERAFVLLPLRDVAPGWRHPATGETLEALIARLPPGQAAEPADPA